MAKRVDMIFWAVIVGAFLLFVLVDLINLDIMQALLSPIAGLAMAAVVGYSLIHRPGRPKH